MKPLKLVFFYPDLMNIYGDRGNVMTIVARAGWRGIAVEVAEVGVGSKVQWSEIDILVAGGGQDRGQSVIDSDLVARGAEIRAAVADGMAVIAVCGSYQLFGQGFTTLEGITMQGIGVFDAVTRATGRRMIGNIVIESQFGQLVGFENHSGATQLGASQAPLGRVKKGAGNNGRDKTEGAVTHNAIGTYLHGPVLPKNPRLADALLQRALERRSPGFKLEPLDDSQELTAAGVAARRQR